MAINVYEKLSEKSAPKSSCSKSSNLSSCLIKLDYNADGSITSSKNDSGNKESPYLRKDKVQMHTRVTERKLIRKKTDFVSSFPLAVNIYKANSDEFKVLKRGNKKIKKSVLTLPNDPAPVPQMCTVSDVNDSEYFNENKDERKPKPRKKRTMRNEKKTRKGKSVDVYDRDARYCSQLDIDLDSSSTDFINQFTGDGKKQRRRKVPANKTEISAHDVWAILRNLNQFQFVPSQPMSQGSLISVKKKTNMNKIRSSCRDARLIETCRTEEFAYISSFVDTSHSQSSLDRITVIEKKQDDYQEICKEIEKSVENCKSTVYRPNQKKTKSKATRKLHSKGNIGNNRLQVNHQQSNNNCPTDKDQRNEIGLKIKSGIQKSKQPQNNQDDIQLCGDFNSCQTFNTDKTNKYYCTTQDENKLHRNRSKIQINGITKVVLSKGNNIDNKKNEVLRKTAESLPVAVVMPKLNAEIPQEAQTSEVNEIQNTKLKRGKLLNHSNLKAANNGEIKPNKFKHYYPNAPSIRNKLNDETKLMFENNVLTEVEPEIKQKRQLRDKMLQFLYKKHQGEDDNIELTGTKANTTENKQVEVGTNTQINSAFYKEANQSKVNGTEIENTTPMLRRTRTKGKWASDFIECVIKKIRSGVYYNNEKPLYKGNCNKREDSSQTDINTEKTFIQMNYPDHTKPQYLKREELIKTLPSHNSPTIKREIINNKQLAKELSGTDAKLHNKSNLHVQTSKGRSKNVNFEDIVYNTQINFNVSEEQNAIKQNETVKDLSKVKQSWVEGKWASDFIDNVFKKIKSGVYYTQDEHGICRQYVSRIKDDSSQTDNNPHKWNYDHIKDLDLIVDNSLIHDSLMLIPGFDNVSNELEIETFSKKQITVKNCVTNVVVQFDVALPSDPCQILRHKQSFSCIPLAVTESHTTIFKSKTTIINAFLPAELCSILPKMMRRIIAANAKFSLPKLTVGKIDSNLSTISELTRCESSEFAKQITYDISEPRTSDKLLNIKSIKLFDCIVKPMILLEFKSNEPECIQINNSIFIPKRSCMALQLYQPLNKIIPAYKPFNLEHYIENLINIKCLNLIVKMPLTIHYFKIRCYNKNITISVRFQNEVSNINVKIMLSNISMDTLCNNFKNSIKCAQNNASSTNELKNGPNNLDIDTEKTTPTIITENRRRGSESRFCNSKNKKKSFARLYKKCSSMSNLSNRSTVSIDKISNTDEFVQALGSSKILSTVIDGNTERKILVSLKEMKNWMTDITPRQALLVLLLANKKDTPNVVRYRPVVLQGIAVSRITRASELDMEIEVIERENLNKLKEFEGISYLPASVENQDTLLEELYWIAKTTASDYQRPFDESSERLLKSLLEKRKKLNPSYLRVMARYVGLGLLKSPK